jgi:hypothetical protein
VPLLRPAAIAAAANTATLLLLLLSGWQVAARA